MWKLTYHTKLSSVLLVLAEISYKIYLRKFNWVCENFSHLLFVKQRKFSQIWDKKKFLTKFSQFHKCEIENNFFQKNFCLMIILDISDKSSQIIFSDNIAKTLTTRQSLLSKHELICEHNMSLAHIINYSYIFLILNFISCQYIFHKVNDLCKNTTAIERTKLSNKILYFRIQHLEKINQLCQLQNNFW